MTELSSVRNLQPLKESSPMRQATTGVMRWLRAKVTRNDLVIVVAFCLIGLLLTLAATVNVPDFAPATGEIILVP
jgi:hypothetical protein